MLQESSAVSSISQDSQMDAIDFVEKHCRFFDEEPPEEAERSHTENLEDGKHQMSSDAQNQQDDDESLESFADQAIADDEFTSD